MIQKKLKILDKLGYKDRNGDGFREDLMVNHLKLI